jgi:hypothetical protein
MVQNFADWKSPLCNWLISLNPPGALGLQIVAVIERPAPYALLKPVAHKPQKGTIC